MNEAGWIALGLLVADWGLRIGLAARVVLRRRPVGVSLAWLAVLLGTPYAGALAYMAFGEPRLGRRRAERAARLRGTTAARRRALAAAFPDAAPAVGEAGASLARVAAAAIGQPVLPGNALDLLDGPEAIFDALIADVRAAERSCHLEFYIWADGGRADDLADALAGAARRGVACRLLVDAVGSAEFLRGPRVAILRAAGVELAAALPVGLARSLAVRFDLRLHRKVVVIDGRVAYTGSQNVADPRFFKQKAGVGEWVDAMVRLRGPAVAALSAVFAEDWALETGRPAEPDGPPPPPAPAGPAAVQAIPSGPDLDPARLAATLLEALYAARRELVLTTPYFVPDEPILVALASAAARGAEVTLVIPARNDSRLVDLAGRAFQGDLAAAGVRILRFRGGLLHTKSITVDGRFALFGSLNLDPRSLRLNFEITLAVYDADFTARLRALQQSYIDGSAPFDLDAWRSRRLGRRLLEDSARLVGPLL